MLLKKRSNVNTSLATHWKAMCSALLLLCGFAAIPALGADRQPNILVIWGDDIGQFNISAYNMGIGRPTSTA